MSLDFGNDDPASQVDPLEDAHLTGFDAEGGLLAEAVVTPNRDRSVNQSISISSDHPIARALFSFPQLGLFEPSS